MSEFSSAALEIFKKKHDFTPHSIRFVFLLTIGEKYAKHLKKRVKMGAVRFRRKKCGTGKREALRLRNEFSIDKQETEWHSWSIAEP